MRYIACVIACFAFFFSPITAQETHVNIRMSDNLVISPDISEEKRREEPVEKHRKIPPKKAIFLPKTGQDSQLSLALWLLLSGVYIEELGRIEKEDR